MSIVALADVDPERLAPHKDKGARRYPGEKLKSF
jgi:hypothetical protein